MFEFNEYEYKELCKKAMLNYELSEIFLYKIKGYSITKIALKMHMSERTVNRRVRELKRKIMKCL